METTALSDLWRDIETTEPNDRRKLAKELGLPDLQARVLVQDRQLSQAIEGDDSIGTARSETARRRITQSDAAAWRIADCDNSRGCA